MKFLSVLAGLVAIAAATPTPTVDDATHSFEKRASISEAANLGYATLNGGTKGGSGGTVTTVSTLAQFTQAVDEKDTSARIVVVKGVISGNAKVRIGSNKSVIGLPGAGFNNIGLYIRRQKNVIVRNLKISNVVAENGDAISIDASTNVWVDHNELSSALVADKDYYDGLLDASHGADYLTFSYNYFHDHHKASLVGHSDSNSSEDKGKLRVTYANNYWKNVGSRTPLLRFGTAHIYNNYYDTVSVSGVNSRMGAQALLQSSVFRNSPVAVTSRDSDEKGSVALFDVNLGGGLNDAPQGSMSPSSPPYSYSLLGASAVANTVPNQAGARLSF
ncbi:pectate lyase [Stachybotrys elegans]|uniref:Pectate lyase n=1 Tax=Stachybotrys elegans TaxID=80388 RepID=A0A8K0SLQ8_9HYPO|nr:pectate lyase [Stachybotrys elegans]